VDAILPGQARAGVYVRPNANQIAVEGGMTDLAVWVYRGARECRRCGRPISKRRGTWWWRCGRRKVAGSDDDYRLSLVEQIPDAQLEAGEKVVSADDVLGAQDDGGGICLTHR